MTEELQDYWRDVRPPPPVRTYRGYRHPHNGPLRVTVQIGRRLSRAVVLPVRLDLVRHSPTGFEWGCARMQAGSGPAQLACAILANVLGKGLEERAVKWHQAFKREVIVGLPQSEWTLTSTQVLDILNRLEGPGKGGDRGG